MHKLVIMIEPPTDKTAFQEQWPRFLHLAEKMPGLIREATSHVENVFYGDYNCSMIHELFFENAQATYQAMSSQAGREAGKHLQYLTNGKVVLFMADHREDELEHINQFRVQENDEPSDADLG